MITNKNDDDNDNDDDYYCPSPSSSTSTIIFDCSELSTKEQSKCIKAIDESTVQKICSGQVIISLAIAIKELVENSLDAGATIIEVKLKEYGLELIEVSDNGCGVKEDDFEGMTSRYSTSKISDFCDLQNVDTFGFRGEALNSLCALSDMVIMTRHKSADVGSKLKLNHKGLIIEKIPCARQIGTTVTLTNIFSTLPVRKKDYLKNIKKEFIKMCQILQAYCLISTNVRIICTNQTLKGSRNTFMCTNGASNIRDNIHALFGSKQLADIIEIKPPLDCNEKFTSDNLLFDSPSSSSSSPLALVGGLNDSDFIVKPDDIEKLNQITFHINGWISSCAHGCGRSSRDRQYFYVNSRPCEPKNITKLVNEIYRRYNSHQYPFVLLNICTDKSDVDVNLTPDKRMLLINNEKLLLLVLRKSLLRTFSNIPSSFQMKKPIKQIDSILKQEQNNTNLDDIDSDNEVKIKPIGKMFMESLTQWKASGLETNDKPIKATIKRKQDDEFIAIKTKIKKLESILKPSTSSPKITTNKNKNVDAENKDIQPLSDSSDSDNERFNFNQNTSINCTETSDIENVQNNLLVRRIDCKNMKSDISAESSTLKFMSVKEIHNDNDAYVSSNDEINQDNNDSDCDNTPTEIILDSNDNTVDDQSNNTISQNFNEIDITIDDIRSLINKENIIRNERLKLQQNEKRYNRFNTEINPSKNQKCEDELKREIKKEQFKQMLIIGQFNLGFIIVKLNENLFIIDQHATDEKYNFELLQKTTKLHYQPLAIPQNLELSAVNEMILIDNLHIFEANGFKFQIDENAPVTKKIKLIGKPLSKNWELGKDDIDELIFMLQDAPEGYMCRPSRIRSMFASRACRKSIMIGKALNEKIMRKLVNNMGEIEQPWNCPHGRPTIRHLVNLDMIQKN